jgi:hypothetical protein
MGQCLIKRISNSGVIVENEMQRAFTLIELLVWLHHGTSTARSIRGTTHG